MTLSAAVASAQAFYTTTNAESRNYNDVQHYLRDLAKANPQNAQLIKVGQSDDGRPVEALKIGHGRVSHLIVATHHGNEYASTEVALAAAQDLSQHPILDRTVYVVPVLNISGYDHKNRLENLGNQKFDANRDYDGPCEKIVPWKLKSTRGMANFIAERNIVSAATLHTSGGMVAYPWGNSASNFTNMYNKIFVDLAKAATAKSHYTIGVSGELVYPADNTFEDYVYWKHGVWSLLFEMGQEHMPDQAGLDRLIHENVPGLRRMMERAPVAKAVDHRFTASCTSTEVTESFVK